MFTLALAVVVVAAGGLADWRLGSVLALWFSAWWVNAQLARGRGAAAPYVVPVLFGVTLLGLWEVVVTLWDVPLVILPAPSDIWAKITTSTHILWADFHQTFIKGALPGYAMGCAAGIGVGILADRFGVLRRGLLPV
ncbi:MAG: ABC transporter permease, partial [Pseudomonadota bacterium]